MHEELIELLEELEEYMDNRSGDLDGDYGERRPNKEMTLAVLIREQIDKLKKESNEQRLGNR